jgi:hypothetical protein
VIRKLNEKLTDRLAVRLACWLVLSSLATTVWAVFDPRPLVVIAAMSIGQGLGILGVAFFALVVGRDLWRRLREGPRSRSNPPPPPAAVSGEQSPSK